MQLYRNRKNLETVQMSTDRWTDKPIVMESHKGTLLSNEKEQVLATTQMHLKITMLSDRGQTK